MLYIVFGPLNGEKSHYCKTILVSRSGFGSSPKLDEDLDNQFAMVTHPKCPPSFIRISPQLFEISCTLTDRQTEMGENITFTFGGGGNQLNDCSPNGLHTPTQQFIRNRWIDKR